jgi:Protein of unknown function (DUF3000)
MNQTGVYGTGSRRQACKKTESRTRDGAGELTARFSHGQRVIPQRAVVGRPRRRRTLPDVERSRGIDQPVVDPPEAFARAVRSMQGARLRPEIVLTETPAPQRVAPYAAAFAAEISDPKPSGDPDLATGRLVLLHDPAGQESWHGEFRLVCYVRAPLDREMAADPLFGRIGWSWLTDALASHSAAYTAPGGTVTRVASESFGGIAGERTDAQMEIRASWTPLDATLPPGLAPHVGAFCELLGIVAGLPPLSADGAVLPLPRGPRAQ